MELKKLRKICGNYVCNRSQGVENIQYGSKPPHAASVFFFCRGPKEDLIFKNFYWPSLKPSLLILAVGRAEGQAKEQGTWPQMPPWFTGLVLLHPHGEGSKGRGMPSPFEIFLKI